MVSVNEQTVISSRRFWVALVLQGLLIAFLAVPSLLTYWTGTSVILQTVPVDPYDLLRGYSQSLRYDISNLQTLDSLQGSDFLGDVTKIEPNTAFYVILQAPERTAQGEPPTVWTAIAISRDLPKQLASNQIALRGEIGSDRSIKYGLESYYFPEDQQKQMNDQIRSIQGQSGNQQNLRVEIRVDHQGRAVPVSLWIGDRKYQF